MTTPCIKTQDQQVSRLLLDKEKKPYSSPMTLEVYQMSQLHIEGNIIPMEWFKKIVFESGRPDMNAIVILADIVYWYRPAIVRAEQSGQIQGYRKKFKEDYLRRSYHDFETLYGLTKRQTRECLKRLEDLGLIEKIFRDLETPLGIQRNIMYVKLNPLKVAKLSTLSRYGDTDVATGEEEKKSNEARSDQALNKALENQETPANDRAPSVLSQDNDKGVVTSTAPRDDMMEGVVTSTLLRGDMVEGVVTSTAPRGDMIGGVVTSTSLRGDTDVTIIYRNGDYLRDYSSSSSSPSSNVFEEKQNEEEEEEEKLIKLGSNEETFLENPTVLDHSSLFLREACQPKPGVALETLDPPLLDQALKIWNDLIQQDKALIRLTDSRRIQLQSLLARLFENDLGRWTAFCQKVLHNKFLMGGGSKGWRVTFDWILVEANAVKALEDPYWTAPFSGEKPPSRKASPTQDLESFREELRAYCQRLTPDPRWYQISLELAAKISIPTYKSWFWKEDLLTVNFEDSRLKIYVSSLFIKDYLRQRFIRDLQTAAETCGILLNEVLIEGQERKDHE